jgi:hypothetical protein
MTWYNKIRLLLTKCRMFENEPYNYNFKPFDQKQRSFGRAGYDGFCVGKKSITFSQTATKRHVSNQAVIIYLDKDLKCICIVKDVNGKFIVKPVKGFNYYSISCTLVGMPLGRYYFK